jgi:glycosyltransferase 2 family protein
MAEPAAGGGSPAGRGDSRAWKVARWAGSALAVAALAWVLVPMVRTAGTLRDQVDLGRLAATVAGGAVAYSLLTVLAVTAWWWLLGAWGRRPAFAAAYAVWARSQVAKYLPGNVFHYLGRQLLGARAGVGQAPLAGAAVLEMVSILAAAAGLLGLTAAVGGGAAGWGSTAGRALLYSAIALVALAAVGAGLRRLTGLSAVAPRLLGRLIRGADGTPWRLGALITAIAFHAGFLVGSGAVLAALLRAGWGEQPLAFSRLLGAYALAWAAGTVTVGAPAGLGVREAVLTLELSASLGQGTAAALAVLFRLVTVAGDLLTAGAGWRVRLGNGREPD